jgi:outer membrane protein assembly factor BamB
MKFGDFEIKDQLEYGGKTFVLLSMYENELSPEESIANIVALDRVGNLIWTAEAPTKQYDIYARIYIKDDRLFAASSAGQLHEIDKETGKVITSEVVK